MSEALTHSQANDWARRVHRMVEDDTQNRGYEYWILKLGLRGLNADLVETAYVDRYEH